MARTGGKKTSSELRSAITGSSRYSVYRYMISSYGDVETTVSQSRIEQAMMVVKPLDLVVRHVVLNVVFKREWIRTVGREREVDFDTGPML